MATIQIPSGIKFGPNCGMGQNRYDLDANSDATGSQQVRLLAPPRWTLKLVQPEFLTLAEGGVWAAFGLQLRGRVNVLEAYDPVQQAPLGTLRGALTLASAANPGDGPSTPIVLTGGAGQAGKTLLPGDKFRIGSGLATSQLVMVTSLATTDGSGVVSVYTEPPLRPGVTYASGTGVAWSQPTAFFRVQTQGHTWTYNKNGTFMQGMSFDLLETWTA